MAVIVAFSNPALRSFSNVESLAKGHKTIWVWLWRKSAETAGVRLSAGVSIHFDKDHINRFIPQYNIHLHTSGEGRLSPENYMCLSDVRGGFGDVAVKPELVAEGAEAYSYYAYTSQSLSAPLRMLVTASDAGIYGVRLKDCHARRELPQLLERYCEQIERGVDAWAMPANKATLATPHMRG